MSARFSVGIDLGTTNCAIASTALEGDEVAPIRTLPIAQLVNPGEVESRSLLPSFLYVPGELDFPAGSLALPWDAHPRVVIGELARKRGSENPGRLVASAKSWLSYGGHDRTAAILPWGAPDDVEKVSPVGASARYLAHLRAVWDAHVAADDSALALDRQEILLTVPASFDEDARELTLVAAREAGLGEVRLQEEPQAAFYAWIESQGNGWRRHVSVGDLVLVCDIGGGTTDFTLIAVSERDGELSLERVAVGDHILLGGDNMDLALARVVQARLAEGGHQVDAWQLQGLWHQCRVAKERLFEDPSRVSHPVTVLGKGRRLVGGSVTSEVTQEDLTRVLLDGFFPRVARDEMPARGRRVGVQELGLPYAADAAVTRHLARFLARQALRPDGPPIRRGASGLACPTHVLFNGGVMKAPALRARVLAVLNDWIGAEGFEPIEARHVLDAPDMEHAVAVGAAYYGRARRGRGIRIRGGAPRTYYLGVESAMPAVPGMPSPLKAICVVPFGMEEGTHAEIPGRQFGLVVGEPAEFRFFSSTVRKEDPPGTMIDEVTDELEELGPLEVTLTVEGEEDTTVPVTLESHVTEIGTLEVWCVARDRSRRWKLQLNIRDTAA